ncbi:hypothetical protein PIB30_002885 [Stylosanthes scabra]|uniref:Uncharacterized protein n=1 Tax=Stylosanthes scabra TaxID=79078 RepID=A0ABU6U4R6_9FABA|nr:hypothetical protein [Stylosanthes scabra]
MDLGNDIDLSQPYTQSQQEGKPHLLGPRFHHRQNRHPPPLSQHRQRREMVALLREPKPVIMSAPSPPHFPLSSTSNSSPSRPSFPTFASRPTVSASQPCQIHIFAPPSFPNFLMVTDNSSGTKRGWRKDEQQDEGSIF